MKKTIAYILFSFSISLAVVGQTAIFPNIFTPNNDGKNDVFETLDKHIPILNCYIYNRYGNLVYELTKPNQVWDGRTSSGIECKQGIYYYVIFAIRDSGEYVNEKGFVELIR